MRCRSCNVLNMHALGKRVTQISMNARAVAGVNEVNCLGMLGCGMWGQLLIGEKRRQQITHFEVIIARMQFLSAYASSLVVCGLLESVGAVI